MKVLSGFFSLTGFFPLYIFWTFKSFDTSKNEHSNANFDGWDGIFFFLFWLLHVKSDDDLLCCIATGLFFILSCVFFLQAFSINDNWWIWCTLWHDCLLNASTKSISLVSLPPLCILIMEWKSVIYFLSYLLWQAIKSMPLHTVWSNCVI